MSSGMIATGTPFAKLPESYIRPESDRPNSSEVSDCENIPVIDLGCEDRQLIVGQIGEACQEYGFFQVINHGVGKELTEKMQGVAREFFSLSVEEKMKLYFDDPSKTMRLSTSFNVNKETIHNWRDYLRLHCYPLDKEIVSNYCKEVRELEMRLEECISESLGLEKEYREQGQHMAINYYPECPEPDLTYGLPGHTDPNALTILLQDLNVSGLQVLKQGRWLAVKPHPDAFVINIGDQFQEKNEFSLDDEAQTKQSRIFWWKSPKKKMDILESRVETRKREAKDVKFNDKKQSWKAEKHIQMKKEKKENLSKYKERTNTQILVCTLIITVTFTVGFTMPGGLRQSEQVDEGLVVLSKKAAFRAFMVSDAIALLLSTSSLFFYLLGSISEDHHQVAKLNVASTVFNIVSIAAMMLTFIAGTYVVLSHSPALAITVCIIGSLFFPLLIVLLIKRVCDRQVKTNED